MWGLCFSPVSETLLKYNLFLLQTLQDLICMYFQFSDSLKYSHDRNLAGEIAQEFQKRQVTILIHVIMETGILCLPLLYLLTTTSVQKYKMLVHGTSTLIWWWLLSSIYVIVIKLCLKSGSLVSYHNLDIDDINLEKYIPFYLFSLIDWHWVTTYYPFTWSC